MAAIYIAARFSRRSEANALANELQARGHTITSRWVLPHVDHVMPTGLSAQAEDAERCRFATEDMQDVRACDCMVTLMEEPRSNGRGGRHVEYGAALALGKGLVIIGPRETVFHHLPQAAQFDATADFLRMVDAGLALAPSGGRPFAKLFDTPDGQLLVTKEFDDIEHDDAPYRLSLRGEGIKGVDATISFGWGSDAERDDVFAQCGQDDADRQARELAQTLANFMAPQSEEVAA